jgi:hypothetical protein
MTEILFCFTIAIISVIETVARFKSRTKMLFIHLLYIRELGLFVTFHSTITKYERPFDQ